MANGLDSFAQYLIAAESNMGEFVPRPYIEPETDSLVFYIRDESSYSKRITRYFTVFLANSDDSLVGFEIKGLRTITKAICDGGLVEIAGPLSVRNEDGAECGLSVLMRVALIAEPDSPINGKLHDQLAQATQGVRVNRRDLCGA